MKFLKSKAAVAIMVLTMSFLSACGESEIAAPIRGGAVYVFNKVTFSNSDAYTTGMQLSDIHNLGEDPIVRREYIFDNDTFSIVVQPVKKGSEADLLYHYNTELKVEEVYDISGSKWEISPYTVDQAGVLTRFPGGRVGLGLLKQEYPDLMSILNDHNRKDTLRLSLDENHCLLYCSGILYYACIGKENYFWVVLELTEKTK